MRDMREHRRLSLLDELTEEEWLDVWRQRVSPGKVTLTSRLQAPVPTAQAVARRGVAIREAQPRDGTSVQRKVLPDADARRAEMARWETAALLGYDPEANVQAKEYPVAEDRNGIYQARHTVAHDVRDVARPIQAGGLQRNPDAPVHLPGHGGGAEMPADVRAKMETAFGVDFSLVRIHEESHAQAVGALAYTQGTDIHFAPGQYQPQCRSGQELLGHELTHVVQQSQGRVQATTQANGVDINDDASLEREADEMGVKSAHGEPVSSPAMRRRRTNASHSDGSQYFQELNGSSAGGDAPLPRQNNSGSPVAQLEGEYAQFPDALNNVLDAVNETSGPGSPGYPGTYHEHIPVNCYTTLWDIYKALHWTDSFGQSAQAWAQAAIYRMSSLQFELTANGVPGAPLLNRVETVLAPFLNTPVLRGNRSQSLPRRWAISLENDARIRRQAVVLARWLEQRRQEGTYSVSANDVLSDASQPQALGADQPVRVEQILQHLVSAGILQQVLVCDGTAPQHEGPIFELRNTGEPISVSQLNADATDREVLAAEVSRRATRGDPANGVAPVDLVPQEMSPDSRQVSTERQAIEQLTNLRRRLESLEAEEQPNTRAIASIREEIAVLDRRLPALRRYRTFAAPVAALLQRLHHEFPGFSVGNYGGHSWSEFSVDVYVHGSHTIINQQGHYFFNRDKTREFFHRLERVARETRDEGPFTWRALYNDPVIAHDMNQQLGAHRVQVMGQHGPGPSNKLHIHLDIVPQSWNAPEFDPSAVVRRGINAGAEGASVDGAG